jgi:ArsR family transcriptional regulator, arsenate/arsenite/antimonite-responsive transcriptional repressor
MMEKQDANTPDDFGRQFHDYLQRVREDRELYRMKAQVAKALAHESRLMIIDALYEKDMCVGELSQLVQADQSTVSKHLSVLKNLGVVQDRKERSNKVYYHLRLPAIRGFLDLAMEIIQRNIPRPTFHAVRRAATPREKT